MCPKAGWIQIGTKQNHCGITEKMVKSDFTSENPSKEEKYLIVAKVLIFLICFVLKNTRNEKILCQKIKNCKK